MIFDLLQNFLFGQNKFNCQNYSIKEFLLKLLVILTVAILADKFINLVFIIFYNFLIIINPTYYNWDIIKIIFF
jgi:hypothetical protein